jgi:hypothetical protein
VQTFCSGFTVQEVLSKSWQISGEGGLQLVKGPDGCVWENIHSDMTGQKWTAMLISLERFGCPQDFVS